MSLLGKFIKTKRLELKISQKKIAEDIGVTTQFISNIELGKTPLPPIHVGAISFKLQSTKEVFADLAAVDFKAKYIEGIR